MNIILNKNNATFFVTAIALVLFAIFTLPQKTLINTIIVLGQAHFLIAYIYANKYKKIDKKYIYKFFTLLLIFGSFSFLVFSDGSSSFFDLFLFSTLSVFVFHYFSDEFKISTAKIIENRKIGTISVLLSFLALLLVTVFKILSPIVYLITAVSLVLGGYFAFSFFKNKNLHVNDVLFFSFFLANIFVPIYWTYFGSISVYSVAGFIILFHYTRWYLRYLDIFSGSILKEYLNVVLWCNVFFGLLFSWYYLSPSSGILFLLFNPIFFFGWTLIHIVMSIRKEDSLI